MRKFGLTNPDVAYSIVNGGDSVVGHKVLSTSHGKELAGVVEVGPLALRVEALLAGGQQVVGVDGLHKLRYLLNPRLDVGCGSRGTADIG